MKLVLVFPTLLLNFSACIVESLYSALFIYFIFISSQNPLWGTLNQRNSRPNWNTLKDSWKTKP